MNKRIKKIIPISEFVPEKDSSIMLDTNIMIRIFTPYNIASTQNYDELWSRLQKRKESLMVSSVQISEMINRCIRIEFDLYKEQNNMPSLNYKRDYRSTEDYKEKMEDILDIILQDIVPNFNFVDDCFDKMQSQDIFKIGFSYDFNDALLVEIAKQYNATLITDDGDFGNYNIDFPIVTSNRLLLNMRH